MAFVKDANKSPHWTQINNRVLGGFMGLLTSGAGAVAGVTGDDDAHAVMEVFAEKQQAYEVKAALAGTNGLTRAVSKVGGAAPSLVPALGAGRLAGWAGKLAGLSPQMAQSLALLASSATAGGQSFGSVYNEAHGAYADAGMAEEEARRAALKPAIIGGLITAALTRAGGPNGVEAVFRGTGGKELVRRTLLQRAKMVGLDMTEEALEEGTDQLLQGIVGRFHHDPTRSYEQIVEGAVEAAWIGGVLGGSVSGVREGYQSLWGKDGRLNEAVSGSASSSVADTSTQGEQAAALASTVDADIWKPVTGGGIYVDEGTGEAARSGMAETENGGAARMAFSRGEELAEERRLAKQMQDIAQPGAFRRGPASQAKDLGEIVGEYALTPGEAKVAEMDSPFSADARATYRFAHQEGGIAYVHVGSDRVWVTSADMRAEKGNGTKGTKAGTTDSTESDYIQGGDLLYQAAMTYAYNNNLKFVPDSSVRPIAQLRRNSHMLSSALRHGTTRHLSPFSDNPAYNDHVAAKWKEGDSREIFEHNLELLSRQEVANVSKVLQGKGKDIGDLRYDPTSDTIERQTTHSDGTLSGWQRLSEGDLESLVEGLDPGDSGVGQRTLFRALVIQSALEGQDIVPRTAKHYRSEESLRGGVVSTRRGDKLQRVLGSREAPRELFYSRGESADSGRVLRTGVTQSETSAAEARLKSTAQGRAIYGNVLIVDNRAALDGTQGRPGQQRYHAEDWDIMQDAEGFHDPRDGTVVIFRENVRVLEGETAAQAMARVVVHERVGHQGFDALRKSDSVFAKTWSRLAQAIPQKEMQELEARYKHLNGNRDALALEWFAHRVGNMEGRAQLEPGSLPQRMWQAMRDWVTRYYNPLGDPGKPMSQEAIDAHVRGLIRATQRRMVKGARNSREARSQSLVTSSNESGTLLGGRTQFSVGDPKGNPGDSTRKANSDEQVSSKKSSGDAAEKTRLKGTTAEREIVFADKDSFAKEAFSSKVISIGEREGNVIEGSFDVTKGKATFVFEVGQTEDTLIIGGAHIAGDASLPEVFQMAQALGREQGKKYVIIQGGLRTTGSKAKRGLSHTPRPIKLKTGL